jgi:outer membrane lipoprotein-sorting protein
LLRGVAADEFKLDAEFDNPLLAAAAGRKVSLDYSGDVELDGRTLIKLVAVQNFTATSFVYLEPGSYMMVRRDIVRRRAGKTVSVRTDYADFRPVAGVLMPHRLTVTVDGKKLNETVIERIEANPEVSDALFKVLLGGP